MRETFNAHGHTNTRTTCIGNYNPIYPRMWSIDGIMHPSFRRTQRDCSNGLKRSSKKKARTHTHTHNIEYSEYSGEFPESCQRVRSFFSCTSPCRLGMLIRTHIVLFNDNNNFFLATAGRSLSLSASEKRDRFRKLDTTYRLWFSFLRLKDPRLTIWIRTNARRQSTATKK